MRLPTSTKPGVYLILNVFNMKMYVGSAAKSLRGRAKNHRVELRAGNHPNVHLQRAWQKYGESKFRFIVIEECSSEECLEIEQWWMDHYECFKKGYNRCPIAGSRLGMKMSDETKEKIAKTKRGIPLSDETRAKMSATRQRIPNPMKDPEIQKKLRANHWSKGPRAAEIAAKIGQARVGKVYTPEQRANVSAGRLRQIELKKQKPL